MKASIHSTGITCGDLTLLAYAMHMVETAHSDAAKQLFQSYVQAELRRFGERPFSPVGRREEVVGDRLAGKGLLTDTSAGYARDG